jgi:hypothetical protein
VVRCAPCRLASPFRLLAAAPRCYGRPRIGLKRAPNPIRRRASKSRSGLTTGQDPRHVVYLAPCRHRRRGRHAPDEETSQSHGAPLPRLGSHPLEITSCLSREEKASTVGRRSGWSEMGWTLSSRILFDRSQYRWMIRLLQLLIPRLRRVRKAPPPQTSGRCSNQSLGYISFWTPISRSWP